MPKEISKNLPNPVLDGLDCEVMHNRVIDALHVGERSPMGLQLIEYVSDQHKRFKDPRLEVDLGGVVFENPVLGGAGLDKAGRAVKALYVLGFGGIEVGTVTRDAQDGNPKPREQMVADGVIINNKGFDNLGAKRVAKNLEAYRGSGIRIGVSVGKNKDVSEAETPDAYAAVVEKLYDHASYFAVNVSSPNTPGLRNLQGEGPLTDIVQAMNGTMDGKGARKPLFVKVAPELTLNALDDVIDVVMQNRATGLIATNTTTDPELKAKYGEKYRTEDGGLSGDDWQYRLRVNKMISHIFGETNGEAKVIGSGGVKNRFTALQMMRSGASAVEVVTSFLSEGPSLPGKVCRGLIQYMNIMGFKKISEVIGMDVKK